MACIAAVDIFLHEDRKCRAASQFSGFCYLSAIFSFPQEIHRFIEHQGVSTITSIFVFAIPMLFFLAARGIYKDQKLVKSLDRLSYVNA